eukprot:841645-Lingulodinium_polyedra.AAC.1
MDGEPPWGVLFCGAGCCQHGRKGVPAGEDGNGVPPLVRAPHFGPVRATTRRFPELGLGARR